MTRETVFEGAFGHHQGLKTGQIMVIAKVNAKESAKESAKSGNLLAAQPVWCSAMSTTAAALTAAAGPLRRLALPALVMLAISMPADAATLYRYINDKGYQEIGYSVPNHLVPNGYDVIDESGRLIRRVAAQLSEEEYAAKLERERKLEACEKAVARVHRRYETLEDIDDAEVQFEAQLKESQQNANANLEYNQTELKRLQERAAGFEREGKIVPRGDLEHMRQVQTTIDNLTAQIEQGEHSRTTKAAEFDEERRVFQLPGCDEEQLAQASW